MVEGHGMVQENSNPDLYKCIILKTYYLGCGWGMWGWKLPHPSPKHNFALRDNEQTQWTFKIEKAKFVKYLFMHFYVALVVMEPRAIIKKVSKVYLGKVLW